MIKVEGYAQWGCIESIEQEANRGKTIKLSLY
jgi:hypothetical protein